MFVTQELHKLNAVVNAIGFEVLEVEAATRICRIDFAGKIDELDKRAANLPKEKKGRKKKSAGRRKDVH